MKATTSDRSEIGHTTRKIDRIALARYELSKDFCLHYEETYWGNLLVLDFPDGPLHWQKWNNIFCYQFGRK